MNEDQFIQCAISAMQGMQEAGGHIGEILDLAPEVLAKRSFDIAEAMRREYLKRYLSEHKTVKAELNKLSLMQVQALILNGYHKINGSITDQDIKDSMKIVKKMATLNKLDQEVYNI